MKPDILRRLSALLPERVRWIVHIEGASVMVGDHALPIWNYRGGELRGIHSFPELCLENTLREECVARGWECTLRLDSKEKSAHIKTPLVSAGNVADTPAEALALALIAALEAESAPHPQQGGKP